MRNVSENRERGLYGPRNLTQRQARVVELVAQGYRNRDVALALGTTEQTVKNYLYAIFDKLGMSNRVELALWHESHRIQPPSLGREMALEQASGFVI
jgi:DNA-binding NarL/FixJ family response regulator